MIFCCNGCKRIKSDLSHIWARIFRARHHILALVDAWPPALLSHLKKPAAGSTLTWTIEFVQPLLALSTLDWCKYLVDIEHATDGYGHAAAKLWSEDGQLIAMSRQTVTIFA